MKLTFLRSGIIIGLAAILVTVLSGCIITINSYTIDCDRVVIDYANAVATLANYDNNGDSIPDREEVWIRAVDGAGNILLDEDVSIASIGATHPSGTLDYTWLNAPRANPVTVRLLNKSNGFLPSDITIAELTGDCVGLPWAQPGSYSDGRINRFDIAAPIAIYPVSYGVEGMGLHIYTIDSNGNGSLTLELTPALLNAVPSGDWVHVIASADGMINMHRMGDQWQITVLFGTGKTYVLIFDSIASDTAAQSYTMDP